MKKNDIVIIALKLLGIYLTVQGISSIGMSFGMNGLSGLDNWSLHFGVMVFLLSGPLLIFKANAISVLILPPDEIELEKFELTENSQKAILRIMGIYVATFAIPSLVHITGQIIESGFWGKNIPDYMKNSPSYIVPFISQLVRFLIGLFLALGPNSIIKVLSRFDETIEKMST